MEGVYVIIPGRNEAKHIAAVVENAKKYCPNVIVVDDGSIDPTSKMAEAAGAVVLRHMVNLGKGAALKTGCDYALSEGAQVLVVLDADGQHDPADIPGFLEALKGHDVVLSYREFSDDMPGVLRFGNWFINKTIKLLYGLSVKDSQSGFRAFTAAAYSKIRWGSSDYSMESEMIARAGKEKLQYVEVPIKTVYGDKYKGTTILDGMKIVMNMIFWKLTKR